MLLVFSSVSGTFVADEEINQAAISDSGVNADIGAVGKVIEYDATNKLLILGSNKIP